MRKILENAQLIKDEIVTFRRTIHENPEFGQNLPKTTAYVMDKLRGFGYEPKEICESCVVATIQGKKQGKTFLLRADMDSLNIKEESDCEFKSINGNMHACGHDMHTAMLLGAAKLLKQYQDEIEGTIKLIFQSDEEGFTGAKRMINAGVLENPKVDAAMGLHVFSGGPTNTILYTLETGTANCIGFRIIIDGKGCHGAMPEKGVDPINIASHIYISLQEIISREISASESAVLTIGKFLGGDAPNVIPDNVVMEGTIRSMSKETGDFIYERMNEIVTSTGQLFRGKARLEKISSVPPLKNDFVLTNEIASYIKDIVGEKSVIQYKGGQGMGSEDFAYYSQEVPSVFFMVGAGSSSENPKYGLPMHHPKVEFNEEVLVTGVAIHAYSAIMWLKNNK